LVYVPRPIRDWGKGGEIHKGSQTLGMREEVGGGENPEPIGL